MGGSRFWSLCVMVLSGIFIFFRDGKGYIAAIEIGIKQSSSLYSICLYRNWSFSGTGLLSLYIYLGWWVAPHFSCTAYKGWRHLSGTHCQCRIKIVMQNKYWTSFLISRRQIPIKKFHYPNEELWFTNDDSYLIFTSHSRHQNWVDEKKMALPPFFFSFF